MAMKTKLYDQTGKEVGEIELSQEVFDVELNEGLVHRALTMQLSNGRTAVAHTKTRSERRGSTRKLYKQKGTGRARAGSNRSPVRKGGGVAFGPRNNVNFVVNMNKKERRKALFCALTQKFKQNNLVVVKEVKFDEMKTKNMVEMMRKLPINGKALLALGSKDKNVEKSAANLKEVKSIGVGYLNIHDLLKFQTLVLTGEALEKVNALTK